jgi:hypothetical protein
MAGVPVSRRGREIKVGRSDAARPVARTAAAAPEFRSVGGVALGGEG